MKITIESTSELVEIAPDTATSAIPARVWQGVTDGGIRVQVLVTRIAASLDDDQQQFKKELLETAAPTPDIPRIFPLRMIL